VGETVSEDTPLSPLQTLNNVTSKGSRFGPMHIKPLRLLLMTEHLLLHGVRMNRYIRRYIMLIIRLRPGFRVSTGTCLNVPKTMCCSYCQYICIYVFTLLCIASLLQYCLFKPRFQNIKKDGAPLLRYFSSRGLCVLMSQHVTSHVMFSDPGEPITH